MEKLNPDQIKTTNTTECVEKICRQNIKMALIDLYVHQYEYACIN